MRQAFCEVVIFLLAALSFVSAQDVTLRLVDPKSGKPLSKISVLMHAWNGTFDFHKPPTPERVEIRGTTGVRGIAVFHLPQPVPEHIGFLLEAPTDFYGCWSQVFASETVLRSGVVADYNESKCGKVKTPVSANAGEIVIFERKLTRRQMMLREIP